MSRTMNNFIEDVPSRMSGTAPDSGPFVAANLPCVRFAACQAADARRTYRAVTIDVRRRLADGWMSNVNYTWSRFEGNFDIDFFPVAAFNTSSFIQDGPGTNVEDPNRFGPLFEDRPHVFKVFTSYAVTSRMSAAAYLRVQSGTPWGARGPRLGGRRAELPGARGQSPQPDLDEPGSDGVLSSAARRSGERVARGATAERVQQPDAAVDRRAAVSGSADDAGPAVLRPISAAQPVFRDRQRLRAAAAPSCCGSREFLTAI